MALTKISGEVIQSNIDISSTGIITATNFSGNLNGDVTGSVTGNVTGDLTGNVTGNINSSGVSTVTTLNATTISGVSTIGVTTATVTTLTVNNNAYPSAGPLSNRNKIINGSMEVAQRGTSSTSNGYVSLDRWYVNQSGGSTTFSQETFAAGSEIDSLKNYAKLAVSASSDYTSILQRVEDVRAVPAGSITVSFWAKGTAPSGDLSVWFVQNFGSGGSADVDGTPQTVTLTSSWQRFSLQFTIASTSGKTIGSSSYFQIQIGQHSNTGTTAWELDITGVQLEVGETATPFEHRSYGDELAKCLRYFERMNYTYDPWTFITVATVPGTSSAVNMIGSIYYETKRTDPTVTSTAASTFRQNGGNVSDNVATSILFAMETPKSCRIEAASGVFRTSGLSGWISRQSTSTCYIDFDAEL